MSTLEKESFKIDNFEIKEEVGRYLVLGLVFGIVSALLILFVQSDFLRKIMTSFKLPGITLLIISAVWLFFSLLSFIAVIKFILFSFRRLTIIISDNMITIKKWGKLSTYNIAEIKWDYTPDTSHGIGQKLIFGFMFISCGFYLKLPDSSRIRIAPGVFSKQRLLEFIKLLHNVIGPRPQYYIEYYLKKEAIIPEYRGAFAENTEQIFGNCTNADVNLSTLKNDTNIILKNIKNDNIFVLTNRTGEQVGFNSVIDKNNGLLDDGQSIELDAKVSLRIYPNISSSAYIIVRPIDENLFIKIPLFNGV